jgi:hypothetical protein
MDEILIPTIFFSENCLFIVINLLAINLCSRPHSHIFYRNPTLAKCGGWSPTLGKVGNLESSGTLECSELDSKDKNTSHWTVLGVIGKVLKRRYRKWPCIGHSDICSPSYGQKKGRESNWQFDSRPLKVGNRPLLNVALKSATRRWKALDESYNFDSGLIPIRAWGEELWPFKVPGVQPGRFRDSISGVPTKCAIGCSLGDQPQRIL